MKFRHAAVALALLGSGSPAIADFKDALASRLSADPKYLVVNLPPRPDAWPGAIFTWNLRVPISHGDPNDPALKRGKPIAIEASEDFDLSAGAKVRFSTWFNLYGAAADVADAKLSFPDARVVDMDYGDLVKHVKASGDAVAAAKGGTIPLIVIKSFEGTPTVTLTKKVNASAEAWMKVKTEAEASARAAASSDNGVTYKGISPVVFAFETEQILFNAKDLSIGKITIEFASLPNSLFAYRQDASDRLVSVATGASLPDIQQNGILGGPASAIRDPAGILHGLGIHF
jgi:hypothetical protein